MMKPRATGKTSSSVAGPQKTVMGIVLAKSEKPKQAGIKTGMVNLGGKTTLSDLIFGSTLV